MKSWFNYNQLIASILYAMLCTPALATAVVTQHNMQIETRTVSASDLNLSHEKGVVTLYQRLIKAASKVCGAKDSYRAGSRIESRKIKQQYKTCSTEALNSAVQSVNNEQLTAMHTQ